MRESINAFHELWQLGLVPEPVRSWETLALAVPERLLADLGNLAQLIPEHPHLRKLGNDFAFVTLADQLAPAKWRTTILPREFSAAFRTIEARNGVLHLLPDSSVRFQEAARMLAVPVRGFYSIMLAYATERVEDLGPLLKQIRARLKTQPFAVGFERQLRPLRTTPRATGLSAPDVGGNA
jgi:hypothetical protein